MAINVTVLAVWNTHVLLKLNRMRKIIIYLAYTLLLTLCISSCHKPSADIFAPAREFTPTSLSISASDTVVTISWPASVNSAAGQTYTVQLSQDSTFTGTPELSFITGAVKVMVSDDSIADNTKYFVRVKANQNAGGADSYWLTDTASFMLTGRQIFKTLSGTDIIDVAAIISWTPTAGISRLKLTDENDVVSEHEITDAMSAAGVDTVYNLKPGTTYKAALIAGNKTMGSMSFTTKAAITGTGIIDLRNATDPMVLADTLPIIPSGSIVLLKRGVQYIIPTSGYVFDKSLTLRSGLGFGPAAILSMTTNFDASGSIDSLHFEDLTFAADGADYVMNVGKVANIGKVNLVNCTTSGEFSNSLIRLKTAGDKIGTLNIEGCVFDSIGVQAKYAIIYANASSNAIIDNINISNSTFYYFYYFIREDGVAPSSLKIDACTFNNFINQSGYFVNYSATPPPTFLITNSIFGNTLDPTSSNGIKSSQGAIFDGCYRTADCVFSSNAFSGLAIYGGNASDLFAAPEAGDFTIKDEGFSGRKTAGDPRWR